MPQSLLHCLPVTTDRRGSGSRSASNKDSLRSHPSSLAALRAEPDTAWTSCRRTIGRRQALRGQEKGGNHRVFHGSGGTCLPGRQSEAFTGRDGGSSEDGKKHEHSQGSKDYGIGEHFYLLEAGAAQHKTRKVGSA